MEATLTSSLVFNARLKEIDKFRNNKIQIQISLLPMPFNQTRNVVIEDMLVDTRSQKLLR